MSSWSRLALLAAAAFPLPCVAKAQTGDYLVRSTATPCLRVRPQPSSAATQIDCIEPGTRVTELESVPYWRRVRYGPAETGWVAKAHLEAAPPAADTAVAIPQYAWLEVQLG